MARAEQYTTLLFLLLSPSAGLFLTCFVSFFHIFPCLRPFADVGGFPAPPDADDAKRSPGGAGVLLPEARPSRHVLRRGGASREKSGAAAVGRRRGWKQRR